MVSIARHIRSIAVEGPVTHQAEIQSGGGIRVVLIGARLVLLPVGETIAVVVAVEQIEIHPTEVSVQPKAVERGAVGIFKVALHDALVSAGPVLSESHTYK